MLAAALVLTGCGSAAPGTTALQRTVATDTSARLSGTDLDDASAACQLMDGGMAATSVAGSMHADAGYPAGRAKRIVREAIVQLCPEHTHYYASVLP